jgi:hypothetical protein
VSSITIPLTSDFAAYRLQVQVEGRTYRIRAAWEDRNASWYLSIGTLDEWLVDGERATVNQPVLRRIHALMPDGAFTLLDTDGNGEATEPDLGSRVLLLYTDEVPEAESFYEAVEVEEVP